MKGQFISKLRGKEFYCLRIFYRKYLFPCIKPYIPKGHLGLAYNNYLASDLLENEEVYGNLLLWCGKETHPWVYNSNNKIYLEISPSYKWHFLDPDKDKDFISYQEFIRNYEPIAVLEVPHEKAQDWLRQCENICKELNLYEGLEG